MIPIVECIRIILLFLVQYNQFYTRKLFFGGERGEGGTHKLIYCPNIYFSIKLSTITINNDIDVYEPVPVTKTNYPIEMNRRFLDDKQFTICCINAQFSPGNIGDQVK